MKKEISSIIIVMGYTIIAWGYYLWFIYAWFVKPVFTTLPNIGILQSFGLIMFITLFKENSKILIKGDYVDKKESLRILFLKPLLSFTLALIIHLLLILNP